MADINSPQQIVQDIILRLTEQVDDKGKVLGQLNSIHRQSIKVDKSFYNLGKTAKIGFSLATTGVMAIVKALIKLTQTQQVYFDHMVQLGQGRKSLDNLRTGFDQVGKSTSLTLVSMRDISAELVNFSKKGFSEFGLAGGQKTAEAFTRITAAVKDVGLSGKSASGFIDAMFEGAQGNVFVIKSMIDQLADKSKTIPEVAESIAKQLEKMGEKGSIAAQQIRGLLIDGLGDQTKSLQELQKATEALDAAWKRLTDTLAREFAPAVTAAAEAATAIIDDPVKAAQDSWSGWQSFMNTDPLLSNLGFGSSESPSVESPSVESPSAPATSGVVGPPVPANGDLGPMTSDRAAENTKQITDSLKDSLGFIQSITKGAGSWTAAMDESSRSAEQINMLMQTLGPDAIVAGKSLRDMAQSASEAMLVQSRGVLNQETEKRLKFLDEEIVKGQQAVNLAQQQGKSYEEIGTLIAAMNGNIEQKNKLLSARSKAAEQESNALKLRLSADEKDLEVAGYQKQLAESRLALSKASYGTASLGVAAQLKVAEAIQQEENVLQKQLNTTNAIVAALENKKNINEAEAKSLRTYKLKQLELEKNITQKEAERLNMVKELRDGYIDAIQAAAFGAGKFEKILVTREKNLGKALDARVINMNYLLGQSGVAAGAGEATPYRFGAGGMGQLTGSNGGPVSALNAANEHVNNIADPEQRAIAKAAQQTALGLGNQLGPLLNGMVSKAAIGILGIKGGVNEGVATGEAMRRGGTRGSGAKTSGGGDATQKMGTVVNVLMQIAQMLDIVHTQDSGVATPRPGSSKPRTSLGTG